MILERIAGAEQPQADGAMRGMRRIEGAAKQADAHAVAVERDRLRCT